MREITAALVQALLSRRLDPLWAMEYSRLASMLEDLRSARLTARDPVALAASVQKLNAGDRELYAVRGGVAVVPVKGVMKKGACLLHWMTGSLSTSEMAEAVRKAAADPAVTAILLDVDSPGGQVAGTSELGDAVFAARRAKPVGAYVSDLGASAAYWAASQADWVMAGPTASVGSIGVYMVVEDWSRAAEQAGVAVHVVKSGEMKGAGVEGTKITDAQLADWQRVIDATGAVFRAAVARGRGWPLDRASALADGRVHVGASAVAAGLADALGSFDDALARLAMPAASSAAHTSKAVEPTLALAGPGDPAQPPPVAEAAAGAAVTPEAPGGRAATFSIGGRDMNKQVRQLLVALGMKPEATDEEALAFLDKVDLAQLRAAKPEAMTADSADALIEAGRLQERSRQTQIHNLARSMQLGEDFAMRCITAGMTLEQAKASAADAYAAAHKPVSAELPGGAVAVGADRNRDTVAAAVEDAICLRAGVPVVDLDRSGDRPRLVVGENGRPVTRRPHDRARAFQGRSILEMFRAFLMAHGGAGAEGLSASRLADLLFNRDDLARTLPQVVATMTTSDFPYILQNVLNKGLLIGYQDAPSTWQLWCRRGTAPDFKTISRVSLSEAPSLIARGEQGEAKYVTLSETRETYALAEYAQIIAISRKALINDDLNAFSRVPRLQGFAARRLENVVAYGILTANAALSDSVALFDASTHKNYTSSGTALSVASLGVGEAAMAVQKGPKSAAALGISPAVLLVPVAKKVTAMQLVASTVDPSKNNATPNPYANGLTVVADALLDAASSTAWYEAADPNRWDTVEVCFLAGEESPVFEQEINFDTDELKQKVRHTVAGKALDYRGLYKNAGA